MLVTVLPFFLIAHITTDGDNKSGQERWVGRWSNGPECTYEVLINITTIGIGGDRVCSMIRSDLKCRPKGEDTLSCHFDRPTSRSLALRTNAQGCDIIDRSNNFVGLENFEIRFNSRGIENLVVPRTVSRSRLDIIKAVASQLNTGLNLSNLKADFELIESNSSSPCQTKGKVVFNGLANDDISHIGFQLELDSSLPALNLDSRKVVEIHKLTNTENCPRKATYIFSHRDEYDKTGSSVFMDMTSSRSLMRISKVDFSSYTVSEGILKSSEGVLIARPFQNISLSLKSVNPARKKMPEIRNPASTGIHTYSHLGYPSALAKTMKLIRRELYKRRK